MSQLGTARSLSEGDVDDGGGEEPAPAAAAAVDRTPTFVVEPAEFYYVTRAKPSTITCRAVDAVQINFKCVGQWVPPSLHRTADGLETAPARRRYIQVGSTYSRSVCVMRTV